MIKGILFSFMLVLSQVVLGQDFYNAYEKAYRFYEKSKNASYEISYLSISKTAVIEETAMQIETIDGVTYSKVGEIESYKFESTSVIIDHRHKQIQLNIGLEAPSTNLQNLDVIVELIKKSEKESVKKEPQEKWYTLHFPEGDYKTVTMVLNDKTGEFKKMIYELTFSLVNDDVENDEPIKSFEIHFRNYKKNKTEFSQPLESVLKFDGERFSPQKKYSTYQFVNNYDLR
jgi:hypothetical protein